MCETKMQIANAKPSHFPIAFLSCKTCWCLFWNSYELTWCSACTIVNYDAKFWNCADGSKLWSWFLNLHCWLKTWGVLRGHWRSGNPDLWKKGPPTATRFCKGLGQFSFRILPWKSGLIFKSEPTILHVQMCGMNMFRIDIAIALFQLSINKC